MDYAEIYNAIALSSRGRIGKLWIHKQYTNFKVVAKYYYPENPRSGEQQGWRSVMYDGVYNWRGFDDSIKNFYNIKKLPKQMSGYNRYLRLYLEANYPMIIYWKTLEKSATDPALIPDYMASPYFMRGLDISPITWDGWLEAKETWTYASATTITVPSGAASKYQRGDKIKLTQTTVKYFYITGVADTVLTITAGTSYTLVNAAISANYYSHEANPMGFPDWFNWTPAWTGRGALTTTGVTNHLARFRISGRTLTYQLKTNLTTGGVADIQVYFTPPVNFLHGTANWQAFYGWSYIGGITFIALGSFNTSATQVTLFRYDGANWNLAAIALGASGSYEI